MSSPGVLPSIAGTAVLGVRAFRGQGLAATGLAIGLYAAIAVACLTLGLYARWKSSKVRSQG
jgi:hypothetical protein